MFLHETRKNPTAVGDGRAFERNRRKSDRFVKNGIRDWEGQASIVLDKARCSHFIRYEDLKSDPMTELRKLLMFLRIPEDEDRMRCLDKYLEGSVNRGQPEFSPYNDEQKELIAKAVRRVSDKMVAMGQPPLPYVI